MNAIFSTSSIEGATTKEKAIYVNEVRRDNYPTILTSPPSSPGRPVYSYVVHFPHDALIVTMHIGCCQMSTILVDRGSSVSILYKHALDRMEDTLELARKMILPQTQSLLYGFDGNEAHSPGIVTFPVRADS